MYNTILGALPLKVDGTSFYFSNYSPGATKQYYGDLVASHRLDHKETRGQILEECKWPCCSGTYTQVTADYGISAYFQDAAGVFVNLYIPSTLKWTRNGVEISLTQKTDYPLRPDVNFAVATSTPIRFALRFRIPAWSKNPVLAVNGKVVRFEVVAGTFAEVRRTWDNGDTISLTLPMTTDVVAVDDEHPNLVALLYGPMVLFAIGRDLPKLSRETLLAARQTAPGSAEWRSGNVRFLPWWIIQDEVYATYHDVT